MPEQKGQIRKYADKEMIFEEEEKGDAMYVVNTGGVRIFRRRSGRNIEYGTIRPGEFFGEMAIFSEHKRSASAQAKGATELQAMDAEAFSERVKDPLIWDVMQKLSERIRDIDDRVEALSVQDQVRKEHVSNLIAHHRKTYY